MTSIKLPESRNNFRVLGTWMLSILSGHRRYAHVTAIRCDGVNPGLLGMNKVISEDALRRALGAIPEAEGVAWLDRHLSDSVAPLLDAPWILDIDTTIKPLYGKQEGAVVSYNPHKPGRPSHSYHTYLMAGLRLVLGVEVKAGNEHTGSHSLPGLLQDPRCLTCRRIESPRWCAATMPSAIGCACMRALEARAQPLPVQAQADQERQTPHRAAVPGARLDRCRPGLGRPRRRTAHSPAGQASAVSSCCAAP
ncbi:MAG: hypothetical protein U5N85_06940 [Arcicella sp.]|nr:hypothetical protein [Arcicella sp.]